MTRTALITGASGGIGRSIAKELGTDHNIVAHYFRNAESAEEVSGKIREGGQEAITSQCDISDPQDVNLMINQILDKFGSIDVLVNNGAVFYEDNLLTASDDMIRHTIQVNLEGALYCTREVLPNMMGENTARIVNISSTAGTGGSPTDPTYSASKSGLIGLTKSLAKQYTSEGIFTNAVAPGPVKTEMFSKERRPDAREKSAIDRLIQPEEVAELVRMFATTSTITGQTLVIDGGIRI